MKNIFFLFFLIALPSYSFYTFKDLAALQKEYQSSVLSLFEKVQSKKKQIKKLLYQEAFWWQHAPSVGLYASLDAKDTYIPHMFSLWDLAPHKGKGVSVAVFDTEVSPNHSLIRCSGDFFKHTTHKHAPFFDHGTHTVGLIGARTTTHQDYVFGLAPEASIMVFKTLDMFGKPTSLSVLLDAVKQALKHAVAIANISFTFDCYDDKNNKKRAELERLLSSIPYVMCAAGNDGIEQTKHHKHRIAYPARIFNNIISVGSFGSTYCAKTNSYHYFVSPFSQYEPGKGPYFLAPGQMILSCSASPVTQEDLYAFHAGTSCSAAIMSGFFALLIGEFGSLFSHDQVMVVCKESASGLTMHKEWKEKSLYGVIDMRTALCMLHVLKHAYAEHDLKTMPLHRYVCSVLKIKTIFNTTKNISKPLTMQAAIEFVKIKLLESK